MGMYAWARSSGCVLAPPAPSASSPTWGRCIWSRLGTIERIAQAKAELVQALPAGRQRRRRHPQLGRRAGAKQWQHDRARVFRYGLTPEADLWADEVRRAWAWKASASAFTTGGPPNAAAARSNRCIVRVPLLGGTASRRRWRSGGDRPGRRLGLGRDRRRLAERAGQLRLVVVARHQRRTVIDDTYNASPASTIAALNVLADVQPRTRGRRIAVLGDMRELGSYTDEGHKLVGRRAADWSTCW
jgi:UDP-N-acetylmuramoyl-tripeptide--D-alanyl-D-alanine ligase